MKAWRVILSPYDRAYVLAESRGKATWLAIEELQNRGGDWFHDDWKEVRTNRVPALDGDTITERQLLEGGFMGWAECPCGTYLTMKSDPTFDEQGRVYCSAACREKPLSAWAGQGEVWLLSTEY